MKNHYTNPQMGIQPVQNLSILCASGGRSASSEIGIHSEGKSSSVATAF